MQSHAARVLYFAIVCLMFGAPSFAAEKHLLLGTWSVDVSKLQQPSPPKSVTIKLEEAGNGAYHMTVDIEASDGSKSHGESTFNPDGTAASGTGSADVDVVSMTMPSKRILVMGAGKGGQPTSSRVFSLSDDGKHMIETVIRHLPDGTPYTRVNTWTRISRQP